MNLNELFQDYSVFHKHLTALIWFLLKIKMRRLCLYFKIVSGFLYLYSFFPRSNTFCFHGINGTECYGYMTCSFDEEAELAENMNFTVRKRFGRCRRADLKIESQEIQTPSCSLYTRGGAVPHVILDALQSIGNLPSVVHLTLQTT